jgi:hypothetical protein
MQTDRTIPVEDTDPDQMGTLDDILSDQMDTSDDDMQSDQIDSLARGDDDMEGGGRPPKRRNVEIGMTNLSVFHWARSIGLHVVRRFFLEDVAT